MRYGTQLDSLKTGSVPEALGLAKALGCDGLEVSLPIGSLRTDPGTRRQILQTARELRRAFDAAGMEFISLTPNILLKHVGSPDVIEAMGEAAQILGVRPIRLFFAPHVRWGGPNSVLDDWMKDFDGSHDSRYWMARNADELAALVDTTRSAGLRFVFELHHGYVVNSASAALRLLERHDPNRVGILMDPGNMVFEGNEGWRNAVQLMGPYLAYIHCKNAQFVREGNAWRRRWASLEEGIADYGELMTALKDEGFSGYLSIEDLRREIPVDTRVGGGIRYLRGLDTSTVRILPV